MIYIRRSLAPISLTSPPQHHGIPPTPTSWHAALRSAISLRGATILAHARRPHVAARHGVTVGAPRSLHTHGDPTPLRHPTVMACRPAECHLPAGRHNPRAHTEITRRSAPSGDVRGRATILAHARRPHGAGNFVFQKPPKTRCYPSRNIIIS